MDFGAISRLRSQWADHILIADQQSSDESRQIAQRYPRCICSTTPGRHTTKRSGRRS
jgi:hypothetical protein